MRQSLEWGLRPIRHVGLHEDDAAYNDAVNDLAAQHSLLKVYSYVYGHVHDMRIDVCIDMCVACVQTCV